MPSEDDVDVLLRETEKRLAETREQLERAKEALKLGGEIKLARPKEEPSEGEKAG